MTAVLNIADRNSDAFAAVFGTSRGRPRLGVNLWLTEAERPEKGTDEYHDLQARIHKFTRRVKHKTKAGDRAREKALAQLNRFGPSKFGPLTNGTETGVLNAGYGSRYPDAALTIHFLIRYAADRVAAAERHHVDAMLADLGILDDDLVMGKNALTELNTSIAKRLAEGRTNAFAAVRAGALDLDNLAAEMHREFAPRASRAVGGVLYRRRKDLVKLLDLDVPFTEPQAVAAVRAYLDTSRDPAPELENDPDFMLELMLEHLTGR